METVSLGVSDLQSSRLAYGCMRLAGDGSRSDRATGKRAVHAALDAGYRLFDHADIYGNGQCEALFGEVLSETPGLRDQVTLVGKCGIRMAGPDDAPKHYDSSASYIHQQVEASLRRLATDRLDVLLLHRPDYLMNVDDVAAAFDALKSAGKALHFGVSNFSASQVELLQSRLNMPLLLHQTEVNLHNIDALTNGVLDQCQRMNITPQAWCPIAGVAYPAWGNTFSANDEARIATELARQSSHYEVADWVIALAWLLKLPAGVCPLVGSTTPARIEAATAALGLHYTSKDWYRLLEARKGNAVP